MAQALLTVQAPISSKQITERQRSLPLTIKNLDVNNIRLTNESISTIFTALTSSDTSIYSGVDAAPRSIAFDGTNMWTANYNGNSSPRLRLVAV